MPKLEHFILSFKSIFNRHGFMSPWELEGYEEMDKQTLKEQWDDYYAEIYRGLR